MVLRAFFGVLIFVSNTNGQTCGSLQSLKVMSLNVWGNSWFNDEPLISTGELYNVTKDKAIFEQVKPSTL